MSRIITLALTAVLAAALTPASFAQTATGTSSMAPAATAGTGYPTAATADYVFGCMQANGNTPQSLERCACSFDVVASIVPYDQYVEASTFLSMGQVSGEKGALFKGSVESNRVIGDLRRAQAEAEIRCFE